LTGYILRVYHEGKIHAHYQSQAEKDLITLEEEFHSALKNPRAFFIFNGRFEVYPLKESRTTFRYRDPKDTNLHDSDEKSLKSVEDKKQKLESFNDARLLSDRRQ
jgi:hypothetical protein